MQSLQALKSTIELYPVPESADRKIVLAVVLSLLIHILFFIPILFQGKSQWGSLDKGVSGLSNGYGLSITKVDLVRPDKEAYKKPEHKESKPVKRMLLVDKSKVKQAEKASQDQATVQDNQVSANTEFGSSNNENYGGYIGEYNSYFASVLAQLNKHKRYSREARRRGLEGTVTIQFVVEKDGKIRDDRIIESSGHFLIDQSVLDMLTRAIPFPEIPEKLGEDTIKILLPISFNLQG